MPNPWTKKNPAMSLFLSGANAWAGAARGLWMREAKRQQARAAKAGLRLMANAWTTALTPPAPDRKPDRKKAKNRR